MLFRSLILKSKKDESIKITKDELIKIILVSSIGYAGTAILLFLSYNYISTGVATTIHFMYPIFVILESMLFFKEKGNPIKILSVVLCTIGILMLYGGDADVSVMGMVLAFLSSITYSFYVLYIDKSGLKSMNPIKLTFYMCLIGAIIMFAFSIFTNTFTVKLNPLGWLYTTVLSIVISLGAVTLLSVGIGIIGPQNAAILSTFEPITSVIIGVLVFGEGFGIKILIGCVLILISVVLIAAFDNKSKSSKLAK